MVNRGSEPRRVSISKGLERDLLSFIFALSLAACVTDPGTILKPLPIKANCELTAQISDSDFHSHAAVCHIKSFDATQEITFTLIGIEPQAGFKLLSQEEAARLVDRNPQLAGRIIGLSRQESLANIGGSGAGSAEQGVAKMLFLGGLQSLDFLLSDQRKPAVPSGGLLSLEPGESRQVYFILEPTDKSQVPTSLRLFFSYNAELLWWDTPIVDPFRSRRRDG